MDNDSFTVKFLGTGTSVGVPMIGCQCPVCASNDPRNRRRRTSIYLTAGETRILVDTPPDFREQALSFAVNWIDAVLFTHSHADHIFGFDDIRRFNTIQQAIMPVYAQAETMGELRRIFNYIGDKPQQGLYRPLANFIIIDGSFKVGAVNIKPLEVVHGSGQVCGFRFDWSERSVGFVPDCHCMPPATLAALQGVDVMILDALRYRPHVAHMNVAESLQCLAQIGAPQSYLIHLCHDLDHDTLSKELPPGVAISYDGLTIKIGE